MKNAAAILALALAIPAFAQTPKPAAPVPAAKAAPTVPVEIKERFHKARADAAESQLRFQAAQQDAQAKSLAYQKEIAAAQGACGADYAVNLDKSGELVCQEKPKAAEPGKK